jgi:hypothetical protein
LQDKNQPGVKVDVPNDTDFMKNEVFLVGKYSDENNV